MPPTPPAPADAGRSAPGLRTGAQAPLPGRTDTHTHTHTHTDARPDAPTGGQIATEAHTHTRKPLGAHLGHRLRTLTQHPEYRRGAREMVGVALGIGAWGLVTGVAMVKSGLEPWLCVLMSLTVFAGTAQLAVTPLIAGGAPLWVVWATALCLNLRFLIFSTQWRPYFAHLPRGQRARLSYFCADLNYVLFMRRFPEPKPGPEQLPYFWGGVTVNAGSWHVMSLLGIGLGHRVPEAWGLGFAGTVALLGMTYALLAERRTWLPALVAAGAAVAAFSLPLKLNMLVAIAAAVVVGTVIDHTRPRPSDPARKVAP